MTLRHKKRWRDEQTWMEEGPWDMWRQRRKHHMPWPRMGPPWEHWGSDHEFPKWPLKWRRQRGLLFFRFAGVFGFMVLLVLGGMGTLAYLLSQWFEGSGRMAVMLWFGGCGLALGLPMLAAAVAFRVFRGVATPMADVMAAADAVAEGNLGVRVDMPKYGPHEFRRLARSFNRMVDELQRADQQRRNLTADVAHELRTPLHIIQGNLEGVLDDVYEPDDAHITATLEETRLLARLVEDLRTLSLAEAGQLPLVREPVDVAELLADVHTSFTGQAEAAGIDLCVEVNDDLPTVPGDADRLDQVLGNLMANAVRHTPAGGTITLRAGPIEGGVCILVQDTGEGISAEDLPYVFDRFWRGDRARSHAGGTGSGLGLAIARQLVQAHGGAIRVESDPGQGTTFTIELPVSGD